MSKYKLYILIGKRVNKNIHTNNFTTKIVITDFKIISKFILFSLYLKYDLLI